MGSLQKDGSPPPPPLSGREIIILVAGIEAKQNTSRPPSGGGIGQRGEGEICSRKILACAGSRIELIEFRAHTK
jgi:hypothetical protein